jgi:hypothetical protein
MLDKSQLQTLRIYSTCCFPTATMVTGMRLIYVVRILPVFLPLPYLRCTYITCLFTPSLFTLYVYYLSFYPFLIYVVCILPVFLPLPYFLSFLFSVCFSFFLCTFRTEWTRQIKAKLGRHVRALITFESWPARRQEINGFLPRDSHVLRSRRSCICMSRS